MIYVNSQSHRRASLPSVTQTSQFTLSHTDEPVYPQSHRRASLPSVTQTSQFTLSHIDEPVYPQSHRRASLPSVTQTSQFTLSHTDEPVYPQSHRRASLPSVTQTSNCNNFLESCTSFECRSLSILDMSREERKRGGIALCLPSDVSCRMLITSMSRVVCVSSEPEASLYIALSL